MRLLERYLDVFNLASIMKCLNDCNAAGRHGVTFSRRKGHLEALQPVSVEGEQHFLKIGSFFAGPYSQTSLFLEKLLSIVFRLVQ